MKRLIALALTGALAAALALPASAQNFPTKQINIVVPFTAGSATDVTARALVGANQFQPPRLVTVQSNSTFVFAHTRGLRCIH